MGRISPPPSRKPTFRTTRRGPRLRVIGPSVQESDPEIRTTPYFRPPGYPYCLSIVYFFTDGSYLAPRLLNMLLGLASIVLLFLLTRRFWQRSGADGRAAGGLLLGIHLLGRPTERPGTVCVSDIVPVACAPVVVCRMTFPRALLAGVILGACALMQPCMLAFGPFAAVWMAWVAHRRKHCRA